jgi:hypothetical protein
MFRSKLTIAERLTSGNKVSSLLSHPDDRGAYQWVARERAKARLSFASGKLGRIRSASL